MAGKVNGRDGVILDGGASSSIYPCQRLVESEPMHDYLSTRAASARRGTKRLVVEMTPTLLLTGAPIVGRCLLLNLAPEREAARLD